MHKKLRVIQVAKLAVLSFYFFVYFGRVESCLRKLNAIDRYTKKAFSWQKLRSADNFIFKSTSFRGSFHEKSLL